MQWMQKNKYGNVLLWLPCRVCNSGKMFVSCGLTEEIGLGSVDV
jgi:hypothetical protein